MINKLEVAGVHTTLDEEIEKYITKKIGQLDHYAPRKTRASLHAEVKLKEGKAKNKKEYTCEVILHLPHDTITTSESTINMYAAIDIVEAKLKHQLIKYKELHTDPKLYRRMMSRLRRHSR